MNPNHARPMLAFWLLAAVAASITGLGLNAGGSTITVRAGSPSPVIRDGSQELLLGGVLQATPGALTTAVFTGSLAVSAIQDTTQVHAADAPAPTTAATPGTRHRAGSVSAVTIARPRASRPAAAAPTVTAVDAPSRPGHVHRAASGRGPTTGRPAAVSTRYAPAPDRGQHRAAGQRSRAPGKRAGH